MNASISPEFAQIVYSAGDAMTNGITPLFVFFVIYVAILERANKSENVVTIFGSARLVIPYSIYISIIWLVILIGWFMIGLPIGISTYPGVIYGA
jgi:aminobenzoyl-glutamate transport protein